MEKNEKIRKATGQYKILTGDEYERRLAYLREKAIRDEVSAIAEARREGIEEGIKEGIEEGEKKKSIEIAKKMIKLGMKIEEIQEITELSQEEIKELKNC